MKLSFYLHLLVCPPVLEKYNSKDLYFSWLKKHMILICKRSGSGCRVFEGPFNIVSAFWFTFYGL